jgi:RNA polymerase sigma-70 factor, ECF subfamily
MTLGSEQDDMLRMLYESHGPDLRAYCLRRLERDEAEDALSEIFATAWRRISSIPPGDEARLWLYGVARNVVRNAKRSSRRRVRLSARLVVKSDPPPPGPAEAAVIQSEHEDVLVALSALRSSDQEILRFVAWENLSRADIARLLGISLPAVDMRLHRAVARMSSALAKGDSSAHATNRAGSRGGKP